MNKKIISILIIFSLLAVSLTSISANNTNVDEQNIADMQKEGEQQNIEDTITNEENNTTDENITEKDGNDLVVPSNPEDLEKFDILLNFVTPEGLDYLADQLAQSDETTFKDVIATLRSHDKENILEAVSKLEQNKIDQFFDEFLKLFDTTYQPKNNNPTDIISNTVSQIFGSSQSSDSNIPANNYIKVSPKNGPSQDNPQFTYDGKYYALLDFVKLLKSLYEKGDITSAEFIQALEDNGIDTSDIKVEDGVIQWGYLYIIPGNPDSNATLNDTNTTDIENATTDSASDNTTNNENSGETVNTGSTGE